jgi:hypothetical protein
MIDSGLGPAKGPERLLFDLLRAVAPLRPEARQMVVDRHARSANASRIVQWRLPICATIVTQLVTHFGATSAPRPSLW